MDELINFPNALHDDQVDACSQALLSFSKTKSAMPAIFSGVAAHYENEIF